MKLDITVYDLVPERLAQIEENLKSAQKQLGIKGDVYLISEPPLISRMNIYHRIPVLEIDGQYWSKNFYETISEQDCVELLKTILNSKQ